MAKGAKILNPVDRARKEARKKELKKNKKQRQQVRSARMAEREQEAIKAAEKVRIEDIILPPEFHQPASVEKQRQPPAVVAPKQASTSNPDQSTDQSRPAVIESKPVLFIPKATKFVPASVRSKLSVTRK